MTLNIDRNNNVHFKGFDMHYHSPPYLTRCDSSNTCNICLNLQIGQYSVRIPRNKNKQE